MANYEIILYYNYTYIDDPEKLMLEQKELCRALNMKGRIIIANEGINGTAEGLKEDINMYLRVLTSDPRFANTHIKRSEGNGKAFPKLSIKVRSEIVSAHLGDDDTNPNVVTGKYLQPEELYNWFQNGNEFYIVDMRNDYEHKSGHFEGSTLPSLSNFRDLPKILPEIEHLKDKTILTVCTGGVRCEKASGYLISKGFKDVYQLYGGIVSFMEKYPNQYFKGKLYVFDNRILMGFNTDSPDHEIIAVCEKCGNPSENYINCSYDKCHKHFINCNVCLNDRLSSFCSEGCLIEFEKVKVNI